MHLCIAQHPFITGAPSRPGNPILQELLDECGPSIDQFRETCQDQDEEDEKAVSTLAVPLSTTRLAPTVGVSSPQPCQACTQAVDCKSSDAVVYEEKWWHFKCFKCKWFDRHCVCVVMQTVRSVSTSSYISMFDSACVLMAID